MAGCRSDEINQIIHALGLIPHVEGGYYREMYTSDLLTGPGRASHGSSRLASHIYYLLRGNDRSRIHSLDADEMFHHYEGGPLTIVEFIENSEARSTVLGAHIAKGQIPFHLVRAGTWFGAYVCAEYEYSLVGCTVVPAFDWNSFRLGEKDELCRKFPHCYTFIESFF